MNKKISYGRLMQLYKEFAPRIGPFDRVRLRQDELEFLNTQYHHHPLFLAYQKFYAKMGYLTKLQFAYLYLEMKRRQPSLLEV